MSNIAISAPRPPSWMDLSSPLPSPRFQAILSTYPNSHAKKPNGSISFGEYLNRIQDGSWRREAEKIRKAPNPKAEKEKISAEALLSITPCGLFPNEEGKRRKEMIQVYSGIIAIDIDEFNPETGKGNHAEALAKVPEILKALPECLAFHRSIRGNGFAVFFAGGREIEHDLFYELYRSELESQGIMIDSAPSAVNAYRFVSYDEDIYINKKPSIRKMPMMPPPDTGRAMITQAPRMAMNDDQGKASPPIGKEIDMIHPKSLGNKWGNGWDKEKPDGRFNEDGGEEAFAMLLEFGWKHLSTRSDGIRVLQRPFKAPSETGGSATWGFKKNLFYVFSSNAAPFESNKSYPPFQIFCLLKHGGNWKAAKDELRERYGMPMAKKGRPKHDLEWMIDEDQNEGKNIGLRGDELKIHDFIFSHFDIRYNTRTRRIELDGERLKDMDEKNICLITSSSLGLGREGISTARDIIGSHFVPKYDPFEVFFEKHREKPWKPVLHDIINTLSIRSDDEEFSKLLIRKWLLGIIASMKGVHSTLCLVLIGKQGIGKTNFFRNLLPDELREYYAEHTLSDANEKDNDIVMAEKLLILDDEFAGRNKKEFEKLKANLSKEKFTIRRAYGKHHEELPRLAVLGGTSNAKEILHDYTGNRRVLPIEINGMDGDAFESINKIHLFMELERMYMENPNGFFLTAPEITRLNAITSGNEARSLEHQAILKYYLTPAEMAEYPEDHPSQFFATALDVKIYLEHMAPRAVFHINLIGRALTQIGFEKIREESKAFESMRKDARSWGYILAKRLNISPLT